MKPDLKHSFHQAFTMIELVFVIVVVGILSSVVTSSFQRNTVQEAADQLVSHIRYTQHLAMTDDKFSPTNATWFRNQWHIDIKQDANNSNLWTYSILSANNTNLYAKDPQNPSIYLSGLESVPEAKRAKNLQIQAKFGVSVTFVNCPVINATSLSLYFDSLGRPYGNKSAATEPYSNLLTGICSIVLSNGNAADNVTIEISPETGYIRARK
ncbi:MAG: type II secretion system protein [Erysipelotrichia bacterium]|nr:type II secretion system protein [Erysipelotrichia bacterium]